MRLAHKGQILVIYILYLCVKRMPDPNPHGSCPEIKSLPKLQSKIQTFKNAMSLAGILDIFAWHCALCNVRCKGLAFSF